VCGNSFRVPRKSFGIPGKTLSNVRIFCFQPIWACRDAVIRLAASALPAEFQVAGWQQKNIEHSQNIVTTVSLDSRLDHDHIFNNDHDNNSRDFGKTGDERSQETTRRGESDNGSA
jgi:hypothetical protein